MPGHHGAWVDKRANDICSETALGSGVSPLLDLAAAKFAHSTRPHDQSFSRRRNISDVESDVNAVDGFWS
jgi:hypothetical protein